ncbi:MAG TPA: serine hydrolase domain-containing protein, partial [Hyphomicrobiaceae bacterium]|nr:serine hydrolase domain-containing protein [Hyphomicrobiaceae bacterium]
MLARFFESPRRIATWTATTAAAVSLGLVALAPGRIAEAQQPAPAVPAKSGPTLDERLSWIEKRLELLRIANGVPGLSIAVLKDDRVVLLKGFGERNIEKKLPVTADTLFPIGSISKPMTALLLLMLEAEKRLSLEDRPVKHLPEMKFGDADANARVTLRDLLAHRSGIERADLAWLAADGALTRKDVIAGLSNLVQVAKPGTEFHYNNYAYVAAGEAAARAAGEDFEAMIERRLFAPLGMKSTTAVYKRLHAGNDHSLGYLAATFQPPRAKDVDTTVIAPAGGVISSARDMAEWVRLMIATANPAGNSPANAAMLAAWTKPQIVIGPGSSYALGLFIEEWRGKKVIQHGGNVPGYSAFVAAIPELRIGFAALTNTSNSTLGGEVLMDTIFTGLTEETLPPPDAALPPRRSASDAATVPMTIAGKYVYPNSDAQIVVLRGQHLMRVPGQIPYLLKPLGENSFQLEGLVGYSVTIRPGTHIPSSAELFVKQPQQNLILPRRDGSTPAPTDAAAKDLIARYKLANGDPVEVLPLGGKIAIVFPWQPAYPLVPDPKPDTYRMGGLKPEGAWLVTPRRGRDGRIIGISIKQPNGTAEASADGLTKADITLDELRARHLAAIGGEAVLKAKRTLTAEVGVTAAGMSGTLKIGYRAPLSYFGEGELKAVGKSLGMIVMRFNGVEGSVVEPKTEPRKMTTNELDWHRLEATFQEPLLWTELFQSVALKG